METLLRNRVLGFVTTVGRVKGGAPSVIGGCHNGPPCDSTMERLIANPMPLLWSLVVKKAEEI
jgi:hypothetical protein